VARRQSPIHGYLICSTSGVLQKKIKLEEKREIYQILITIKKYLKKLFFHPEHL
jgi:hypothetical protein